MAHVNFLQSNGYGEDPGAHWFRIIADNYADQFIACEIAGPPPETRPKNTDEDEHGQDVQNANITSGLFEFHRRGVRPLFRTLMADVFGRHDIEKEGGIDIGSGATGEMVNEWLPLDAGQRATWTETDINRQAVDLNSGRHPGGSTVKVASMYDLDKDLGLQGKKVPVVTGLSSLDAPGFLERAVAGVRDVLAGGGYLVHVQDVRPGLHMGTDQLQHEGRSGPYEIALAKPLGNLPQVINPHVYFKSNGVTLESSVELFRRRLGRAITATEGLELVRNDWAVAGEPLDESSESFVYVMNMRGPLSIRYTQNRALNLAYAVVTVARRT